MEIVKLKACDYDDALDFLDFVFSKAYGPTHFGTMLPLCYRPTDEHMGHNFAVRENGKIRGIVGLFPAQIQVGGETLNLGGIGGVSAHPSDRGKGWMKLLMARAIEEMKSTETDLSFLTGLRQRYQHFGYEKTGVLLEYKVSRTNIRNFFKDRLDHNTLQFVPIQDGDSSYIETAKTLHDKQPVHCIRSLEDFRLYLLSINTRPWVAVQRSGKAVGYLVASEKQDRITEIFAENDETFNEMVLSWFLQQNIIQASIFLAPWQTGFARALGTFAEECRLNDNGNWRIFNWEKVVRNLLAIKSRDHRLLNGSLLLKIKDYGAFMIRVDGEEATCNRADDSPDIEWDSFTASRILFGHMPISLVEEIPQNIYQLIGSWFPLPLCWLIQNYV